MSDNFLLHAFKASQALSDATTASYSVSAAMQGNVADIVKTVNENQKQAIEEDQDRIKVWTGKMTTADFTAKYPGKTADRGPTGDSDGEKHAYQEGYDERVRSLNQDQTTWSNYGKDAENNVNIISDEVRRDNTAKENLLTYMGCLFDIQNTLNRALSA